MIPVIDYSAPPLYAQVEETVAALKKRYRQLKVFPVGRSVLGRSINALSIGNPACCTLFVGAVHGQEWLTACLLLRFCGDLLHALDTGGCFSDIDVTKALQNRSVVIIPCLNPDGVEIALLGKKGAGELGDEVERLCGGNYLAWQANANGVDLNHNFDAGWQELHTMELAAGITGPAPTRYGGPHPHSEPETAAVTAFCQAFGPRSLYALHSQGEVIYYQYGPGTPARSRMIAQILASSSGYALARPMGLASHGGLKDWFIEKYRRPGFTVEVGRGKNPLAPALFRPIYSQIEEMLILATLL